MTTKVHPAVLVLSSRYDLTCDLVVMKLRARGVAYFRLNSEDLTSLDIDLDPKIPRLLLRSDSVQVEVDGDFLCGVYFRQPTFLRASAIAADPRDIQFARTHWTTFMRSLMVFNRAKWINHPTATYEAEHKTLQLRLATEMGFAVPETAVTNSPTPVDRVRQGGDRVVVKGLDTVMVRDTCSRARP